MSIEKSRKESEPKWRYVFAGFLLVISPVGIPLAFRAFAELHQREVRHGSA
jgi:hypothetical protein